ncbi:MULTISPECIES: hypothetical protein [Streptomyces]|uniref:hypothetical protein n=1 Tax=Streptomyces TaxID=1883 RepID=UPI001F3C599C|nr:hypothetical protein [Streptomyces noursei]MCE4945189.1 hypothetical protein [Streptomyces noursei]
MPSLMPPYKIARQEHLGKQLNLLQSRGKLTWRGEFIVPPGRTTTTAVWWITKDGKGERRHETRQAEQLVQRLCDATGIIWEPVPHPGGETQLKETLARITLQERTEGHHGA